jgi:phosphate transport system substrate-binding protein
MKNEKSKKSGFLLAFLSVLSIIVLLLSVVITGCKAAATETSSKDGSQTNAGGKQFSNETLTVSGSTTLLEVSNMWAETFMEKNGGEITVNGGGSGEGIKSLIDKTTDLANSSRSMKAEEKKNASDNGVGVKEYAVLWDGIAIVVSKNVTIEEISFEQLSKIYKGEITNWKEIGGQDGLIVAAARDSSSGTGEYFLQEVVRLGNKDSQDDYSDKCLLLQTNADMTTQVSENENIIGYIGLGYLKLAKDSLKALKVKVKSDSNPVAPSIDTVKDKSYPISRELYIYTDTNNFSKIAQAFIDFILSPDGQNIGTEAGFVPVK